MKLTTRLHSVQRLTMCEILRPLLLIPSCRVHGQLYTFYLRNQSTHIARRDVLRTLNLDKNSLDQIKTR